MSRALRSRSGRARSRWTPLLLALSGLALLAVALSAVMRGEHHAVGTHGLRGTDTGRPSEPAHAAASHPSLKSSDPKHFAVGVAHVLFAWDTTRGGMPNAQVARLVAVADPTGVESPGLVNDISNFLPSGSAWNELRIYATRQHLQVLSAGRPDAWPKALAQAGSRVAAGTTAVTIRGIRHRSGQWENQHVFSQHPVAFTAFVTCRPTYPTCRLLRLSLPDRPLE